MLNEMPHAAQEFDRNKKLRDVLLNTSPDRAALAVHRLQQPPPFRSTLGTLAA